MDIIQFSWRTATGWLITLVIALPLLTGIARADEAPVPLNIPSTLTADITPGMQFVEIPFVLSGVDGIIVEAIVPVDNATFTLRNPSGTTIAASGSSGVTFTPGSVLAPEKMLPGGVFTTQELSAPTNGTWTIRLDFPAAPVSTVAVATLFARTAYQAGIALTRESFLTGEDVSIGMLILNNGQPVTGLAPEIRVSLNGSNTTPTVMRGVDDGRNPDGQAADGVYSVDYTFPQAGDYLIAGSASIPTPQGVITREASRAVSVTDPPATVMTVTSNVLPGPGSCIAGIEEHIALNVTTPGEYVVRGSMATPSGKEIEKRQRNRFSAGANTIVLGYSSQEIMQGLGENGPYVFAELDVLAIINDEFTLASRGANVGTTPPIDVDALCRDPIVIGTGLSVEPTLTEGYISALNFGVPINVQNTGNYQFSFKVVGVSGEDIELVGFTKQLAAGSNNVGFTLTADQFQTADGPYAVISALVSGPGGTAQLARVGETLPYKRWQFFPSRAGDLDGDNDVDSSDQQFILDARNQTALNPGDRRDIVRDGRIDLKDARAILNLR